MLFPMLQSLRFEESAALETAWRLNCWLVQPLTREKIMTLFYALLAGLLVSAVSLIGLLTFFSGKDLHRRVSHILLSLAAGAMLGNAVLHLMPHAITLEQEWMSGRGVHVHVHEHDHAAPGHDHDHAVPGHDHDHAAPGHDHDHAAPGHDHDALPHEHDDHDHDEAIAQPPSHEGHTGHGHTGLVTAFLMLAGFLGFYAGDILMRKRTSANGERTEGYLVAFGDGVENLLDGIVIGTAFLISVPVGIAATITIFLHEIPLELGDYAVMRHSGFSQKKALLTNFLSGLLSLVGIVVAFAIGSVVGSFVFFATAAAAGALLYIASCILVPHVLQESQEGNGFQYFLVSLVGVALMAAILLFE
jgi:zinc transporter ZupT